MLDFGFERGLALGPVSRMVIFHLILNIEGALERAFNTLSNAPSFIEIG